MKKHGSRLIIGWRRAPPKSAPSLRNRVIEPHVRKRTDGDAASESNAGAQAVPGLVDEEKT
jgi:hypothetical protein